MTAHTSMQPGALTFFVPLLLGAGLGKNFAPEPVPAASQGLTAEEQEILSHLSIVELSLGAGGGTAKTIRVEGINVQVVNGLGATNGYPTDPTTTGTALTSVNGLGNVIVGYNDDGVATQNED